MPVRLCKPVMSVLATGTSRDRTREEEAQPLGFADDGVGLPQSLDERVARHPLENSADVGVAGTRTDPIPQRGNQSRDLVEKCHASWSHWPRTLGYPTEYGEGINSTRVWVCADCPGI